MLERFRGLYTAIVKVPGEWLLRHHVTPNAVTATGTILLIVAALATVPWGFLWLGGILIPALALTDGIDGYIARRTRPTRFGAFLDSTLDRLADGALLLAVATWFARSSAPWWWITVTVFTLIVGQVIPYARARAESLDLNGKGGLTGRADRIALIAIGCFLEGVGVPYALIVAMAVMAVLGCVTVGQRMTRAYRSPLACEEPG